MRGAVLPLKRCFRHRALTYPLAHLLCGPGAACLLKPPPAFLPSHQPATRTEAERQLVSEQWDFLCQLEMVGEEGAFVIGWESIFTEEELFTALKVSDLVDRWIILDSLLPPMLNSILAWMLFPRDPLKAHSRCFAHLENQLNYFLHFCHYSQIFLLWL